MVKNSIVAVYFDLDGTLIDHFRAIHRCYNHTLQQFGQSSLPFAALKRRIGPPLPVTARDLLGSTDPDTIDRFCEAYCRHMEETFTDGLDELPGAAWILDGLRRSGHRLALFTNKQRGVVEKICQILGWKNYFDAIICADGRPDGPKKPDPAHAATALRSLGVECGRAAMVGDSDVDLLTARRGNFGHCYLVTTGTHGAEALISLGAPAECIFPDLYRLGETVFHLSRAGAEARREGAIQSEAGSTATGI
jgi:phosphoglycolate phosphatase